MEACHPYCTMPRKQKHNITKKTCTIQTPTRTLQPIPLKNVMLTVDLRPGTGTISQSPCKVQTDASAHGSKATCLSGPSQLGTRCRIRARRELMELVVAVAAPHLACPTKFEQTEGQNKSHRCCSEMDCMWTCSSDMPGSLPHSHPELESLQSTGKESYLVKRAMSHGS